MKILKKIAKATLGDKLLFKNDIVVWRYPLEPSTTQSEMYFHPSTLMKILGFVRGRVRVEIIFGPRKGCIGTTATDLVVEARLTDFEKQLYGV